MIPGSPAGRSTAAPGYRAIAVDLDGTLLNSGKRISGPDRAAVTEAVRAGVVVAVITGRRFAELEHLTRDLPDAIFRAGHGGALVRRGSETLAEILLPRAAARTTAAVCRRRGLVLLISDRDGAVRIAAADPASPRVRRYLSTVRPRPRLDPAPAFPADPLHLVLAGSPQECRAAEIELRDRLDGAANLERTEYPATRLGLVDVLGAGASKASALEAVARAVGIPMEATLAIGDNWNDLAMLRAAGRGVLMANADRELHRLGFETTRSNDDSGVAAALRRFLGTSGRGR